MWSSYTPSITATTTNPTFGTVAVNVANYSISDKTMTLNYHYRQTTAGTAGSGDYLISMPPGVNIDTTKIPVVGSSGQTSKTVVGAANVAGLGGTFIGAAFVYNATKVQLSYIGAIGAFVPWQSGSSTTDFNNPNARVSFTITVPIV